MQLIKDLKTSEQASGVGGLHASLPSDAKDEPAAPVRTVLSSRLSAEASAFCPTTGAPFVCVASELQDNCIVPAMPVISVIESLTVREHREKVVEAPMSAFALVARPVGIEERKRTPAAWAACEKEWVGLRSAGKRGCWDEAKVREMTHVEREAKASGKEVHFGRVHELCFEKNPELAPDNPARKFKGRVVFLGNQVRDQNWEMAMFQELGSNPATMGASKACDCFASLVGNAGGQADATAAYTQWS